MLAKLELSSEHAEWLEDVRKIPCEIAAEMGVRSSNNNIAFEYQSNGVTLFRKLRTPDKRFWIEPQGAELRLWNEDCLKEPCSPGAPLIVCEGEFDACAWVTSGATHVVSVPNGAAGRPGQGDIVPAEDRQFAYLWRDNKLHPGIDAFRKIIIATDSDGPGLVLRDELAIRIGRPRCWYVTYPEGCKDANDVLVKFGADALSDILADAKPIVPNRLVTFDDIPSRADQQRYTSGWAVLDKHLVLVPPELVVVTGPPGSGKSQWTLAWCANLARVHGLKGAILQFEDQPDRNREDLLKYARIWHRQEKGRIVDRPEVWLNKMFRTVSPSESDDLDNEMDLKWLQAAIEEAATRHDCKWILIDPWNEVEHVWKVNENETTYTNAALRELKRMARRFQIAIIIVTHPSKSGGQHTRIEDFSLYDVSGSNAWKNKADHGIIVFREDQTATRTFVKIDKSKNHRLMGRPGIVTMDFDPEHATFKNVQQYEV